MSELTESGRVDHSPSASEEGFYLPKEQRDSLLLHLIDVNANTSEEHQQQRVQNKEMIKVLLSLSEGVKVDDPKGSVWRDLEI